MSLTLSLSLSRKYIGKYIGRLVEIGRERERESRCTAGTARLDELALSLDAYSSSSSHL
jgi:hypothetical protein